MSDTKIYLIRNSIETQTAIHGVDYHKGLEDAHQCGRVHEYMTKNCKPVFVTQQDVDEGRVFSSWELVEVTELLKQAKQASL